MDKRLWLVAVFLVLFLVSSVSAANPTAAFSGTPLTGGNPLNTAFTDASTGSPTAWAWFFGDETYNGTWVRQVEHANWSDRSDACVVTLHDGSVVLAAGYTGGEYKNDVWRSTDQGASWSQQTASAEFPVTENPACVVLDDDSIILAGGYTTEYDNHTWRSTDKGVHWTAQNHSSGWSGRYGQVMVHMTDDSILLYSGGTGVSPGYASDTWRSTDKGVTWVLQNATGFPRRYYANGAALPDGSAILVGGSSNVNCPTTAVCTDTWRTTDNGVTWVQQSGTTAGQRQNGAAVWGMPDDTIIIAGGYNNSAGKMRDVWISHDLGVTWNQAKATAEWSARERLFGMHTVLTDGSILLMGGEVGGGGRVNDVWRLQPVGSSSQNPSHSFTSIASYTVGLIASHSTGYDWESKYNYVTVSSVIAPVAAFSANTTSGAPPLNVGFTDASTNTPINWDWYWGADETKSSDDQNPTNSFTTGSYNIRLWASNSAGGDWENKTAYITVGVAPVASFTPASYSGAQPMTVNFVDTSTNTPTSWFWVFGDGNTSTLQNPSNDYYGETTYYANLTATNAFGSNTSSLHSMTTGNAPTASFTKDKSSGAPPLTVTFDGTYTGTGVLTFLWDFDDGDSTNSTLADPIHTFAGAGTYDVYLTVSNVFGSYSPLAQGISVGVVPTANFTRVPTTAQPDGTTYTFTDTSSGATSWNWTFGDGTYSNLQNPTHQYIITSGNTQKWTVALNATNSFGSGTKTWVDCIGEYKIVTANFTTANNVGAVPLTVTFTDTSVNNTNRQYDWENNGTWSANQASPTTYTYTVAGIYSPRIKAFNTWNTAYLTKTNEVNAGTTILADFIASNVTPIEEQTITFTDASLGTPTGWNWSFGDGQYSSLQNPTHAYSGWSITYFKLFNVTLNITKSGVPNATLTKTNYINVSQTKPTALAYVPNVTSGTGYLPPDLVVAFTGNYNPGYPDSVDWYFDGTHSTSWNPVATFDYHVQDPAIPVHVNYSYVNEMGRSNWYNSTYTFLGRVPKATVPIQFAPLSGTTIPPAHVHMQTLGYAAYNNGTWYGVPTSWYWTFGDGATDTTTTSLTNHTYAAGGTYPVTVRPSNVWGNGATETTNYTVLTLAPFGAPLKWVNNAGSTITTARKGDSLTFVFDTNVTGIGGLYNYDRFYINVFRQDMTGAWVEALEVTNYNVQEYGIATMFSSGIHNWMPTGKRWNGYTTFTAANGNATYRGQVTAVNATSSITYPSSVLYADISVTDNPLLMSNVGQAANDTGGFALKLIIGVIIVLGLMAIPFLITREFNTYIEVFMIVLGLGLNYYLGLIDLWIIAGLGILAAVIVFFMSTGGRGGGDTTEGGGGDVG